MEINLTLKGTPEQLKLFMFGGLVVTDAHVRKPQTDAHHQRVAAQALEDAVRQGVVALDLNSPAVV